jgi:hypothetical protein
MRLDNITLGRCLAAGLWLGCIGQALAQTPIARPTGSPDRLVREALLSEQQGPSPHRASLLKEALAIDPDFAPARWLAGFVRWQGQWASPEEVASRTSDDKTLIAYRRMRDPMVDTADNQRALAEWCRDHNLPDEMRLHWLKVLEFDPADAGAHKALGLRWFDGRLLTQAQVNQAKKVSKERQQAIRRFRPSLAKWRAAIEHGSAKQHDEAVTALDELSDTAAVPAIGMTLDPNALSKRGLEFQLLLIETLGRMPDAEATGLLLQMAILPEGLQLPTAAADQLKKRPMFAFVPQLIAEAPATMKNRFEVLTRADGQIVCQEQIILSGRDTDYTISHSAFYAPIMRASSGSPLLESSGATELVGEQQTEAARKYQEWGDAVKLRIQFILERTTGFMNIDDPQLWEKQWDEYNGWKQPAISIAPRRSYSEETVAYDENPVPLFVPIDVPTPEPAPRSAPPTPIRSVPLPPPGRVWSVQMQSCFPAGTPVLTLSGTMPIEKLKSGDRVLAQNLASGELTYKTVQETTLRPAMPLVQLTLGSETVRATPGHPFWVVGAGWRVAKFLKTGDVVHSMNGAIVIDAVAEERPSEVYNLVVSDLHNYFVGQQRLLVHDNSPLEEAAVRIPGLAVQTVAR